jgi:cytochrome c-type biogenesis protein CcmH
MTQEAIARMPLAKIALLVAALIAAFVVGFAIMRTHSAPKPVEQAMAASGAMPPTIENLEQRTRAQPQDVDAWRTLAAAYFDAERYDEAARAYEKASTLAPDTPAIWSALGEARVMASKTDPMPGPAVIAFQHAVALDAKDPRARYFLAVKRDLTGDHAGAVNDWLALLADSPADAPWRADLVRTIEQVGKINKLDVAARIADAEQKAPAPAAPPAMPAVARAIPGPTPQDMAAAAAIPPSQQREMAEGMVARLEARLKSQPNDTDGWIMLMRSRMTLEQPDQASQALRDAVSANPGQAAMLRQQASVLGIR